MAERIVRSKFGTLGTRETFRKGRGRIVSTSIETSDQQPTN